MRVVFQLSFNRWVVGFSGFSMFVCAVFGGFARELIERLQVDSRLTLVPEGPMGYASLSVIALVFLIGMAANAGLILYPLERRRAWVCCVIVVLATALLGWIALYYGSSLLHVLHWGHGVSGGGEEG